MKKSLHILVFFLIGISSQSQVVVNTTPDPLVVCDINNNGFGIFDLTQADVDIIQGDPMLVVTYYISLIDAQTGLNPLSSPYMNIIPYRQVVFARADNTQGDFAIVELELWVDIPPLTQPNDLYQDDDDGDGVAIYDLRVNDALVLDGLDASQYSVSYYERQSDAENGVNFIINPTTYPNISQPQTIFVRVENININCYALASFLIIIDSLSLDSLGFEDLSIFPNPTSGSVSIASSQLVSETTISIYNILGKIVLTQNAIPQNGSVKLDFTSFKNGIYFMKISSEGNETVQKLIKD